MAIQVQLRRDTAANWTSVNPTLAQGEVGIETDTLSLKIGDGLTDWNTLPYYSTGESTIYNSGFNYQTDAIVGLGGKIYISLQDNNLGNDPATEPTWWEEFSGGGGGGLDKTFQTLTEAATITFDASISVNGSVTLTASRILGNITNAVAGEIHCVKVIQGGSGSYTLTYGNQYKFSGGILPILSATVNAVDLLFFLAVSTSEFHFINANFDVKTP